MKRKQIEITGRCNLRCEFCYNQEYLGKWLDIKQEEILKIAGEGNLIYIGGGEPLLYPNIENLIEELLKKDNKVVIST
ncbi:MAG: radical SAM protein [Candidatus Altarchaeaceae archaeon]